MRLLPCSLFTFFLFLQFAAAQPVRTDIRLAAAPTVSPDGTSFAFVWLGDVWKASVFGGRAEPLTRHAASDTWPCWSPDGLEIAFCSERSGTRQVYIMPASGGQPRQVTFHSEGAWLHDWFPDGRALLISGWRDYPGLRNDRLFRIDVRERREEELLFDAYARYARISPHGKKLLFTRDGDQLYRKGYTGAKASQIWQSSIRGKGFNEPWREASGLPVLHFGNPMAKVTTTSPSPAAFSMSGRMTWNRKPGRRSRITNSIRSSFPLYPVRATP